ncbi:MAG: NPCBM/NEW2 domain-containing protein [Candidatus Hydrogenedentes bacterium]|nr:NPCBM/NEW2 domain-containing protein [Candidatus Hydrogenedentota bacterium]
MSITRTTIQSVVVLSLAVLLLRANAVESWQPMALDSTRSIVLLKSEQTTLEIPLNSPRIDFNGTIRVGGMPSKNLEGSLEAGKTVTSRFDPISLDSAGQLEVETIAEWSANELVLRKWARLRYTGEKKDLVLNEVILDELDVSERHAQMSPGDIQSYPAFIDGFFAGIEFPIGATRLEGNTLIVAHRPGFAMKPGEWYETRKAVYGIAKPGDERKAFQRYIASHLPSRGQFHIDYNSWWTSPVPYTEADILKLMDIFNQRLYKPYGVSLDSFCIDMGWANAHTFWGIDTTLFPEGFTRIARAAEEMKSHLGLWISPSSRYPQALDNEWAASQGYETFIDSIPGASVFRTACLGGPKYSGAFRDRLIEMASRNSVRQFKLDGYVPTCPESNHGHAPGILSAEAVAEGFIAAAQSAHASADGVWLEPTCFGWNPSPWWLFYCNSVIGSYGDDAPYGRIPCPVYRESYTTARDYFNLQGAYWSTVPIAAQEVLGIIHQTPEPFMNDAVTTILRGNMFLPLYINPAYMDERRWKSLAGLLTWARANADILSETTPLLPSSWGEGRCPKFVQDAVMPREPYGYAHWTGGRGLILLRNPWIAPQSYSVPLDGADGAGPLNAVSLYPEVRVYGRDLRNGASLDVTLAPYETLLLAVDATQPRTDLPLASSLGDGALKVSEAHHTVERVVFDGPEQPLGPDFTCRGPLGGSGVRLTLDAKVSVSAPITEALLLVEDAQSPESLVCTGRIDGQEANVSVMDSELGWAASVLPRPEHWRFYRMSVPAGEHALGFTLFSNDGKERVSCWLWANKPGEMRAAQDGNALPQPESISLASQVLLDPLDSLEAQGDPIHLEPTIERIDGVYLDTLEPISVEQGYGTLQKNRSVWEKPMTIGGQQFVRGLGTHATARIVYDLSGKYSHFQSWVGADSATTPTVTFEVLADGVSKWKSGLMQRGDPPSWVDIDIAGAKTLELRVGDGGNGIGADHANWAEARVLR